jgi:hypothetical protein
MKYVKMLGLAAVAAMALMAFAGSASATTLEIGGVAQNRAVTITASLKTGTSALLKDELGTTTDTCTASSVVGTTSAFDPPSGPVGTLTFTGCSHTTTVIANGNLSVAWTSGTNGTVSSNGAEVTVVSTFFGASATCKTGTGTPIGTLTGVSTGDATMDINATLNCGILGSSSWTGTYTVTSATSSTLPSGTSLGVVN